MKNRWLYRLLLSAMILAGGGTLLLSMRSTTTGSNEGDFSLRFAPNSVTLQWSGNSFSLSPTDNFEKEMDIAGYPLQYAADGSTLRLIYRDNTILICSGKISPEPAGVLVLQGEASVSQEALAVIQPEFAVLCANAPESSLLELLDGQCMGIYRVDLQGSVTLTVSGEKMEFSTEKSVSSKELFPHRAEDTGLTLREYDYQYVINVRSGTFHSPLCTNLEKMNEGNKAYSSESMDELIAQGYHPCSNCLPQEE